LNLFLVGFSYFARYYAQKWYAKKNYFASLKYVLDEVGIVTALVLSLLTKGLVVFTALNKLSFKSKWKYIPGKKGRKRYFSPYFIAKATLVGPLVSFGLAVLGKISLPYIGFGYQFMIINIWLAVFNMLPLVTVLPIIYGELGHFFGLHKGEKLFFEGDLILFGSHYLWMFYFFFIALGSAGLIFFDNLTAILIGAFLISSVIWVYWHYLVRYTLKGKKFEPAAAK
jgi:hypothetical protein